MVVESMLMTIRSFQRLHNRMLLRWERALLCTGYCMPEMQSLFELRMVGVCTMRELASRLCLSMQQMEHIRTKLEQLHLVVPEPDEQDRQMDYLRLTVCGRKEVERLQGLYERIILSDMEGLSMKEQIELMMYLEKAKGVFERIAKGELCEVEEAVVKDELYVI
jgi:DNA-binding MarR family transcriptional regulator